MHQHPCSRPVLSTPFDAVTPLMIESGWDGALNRYDSNHHGVPLLIWAIRNCPLAVPLLITHAPRAILIKADDMGVSALMAACLKENKGWAKALLGRGSPVDQADVQGITALMIAARSMDESWVSMLLKAGGVVDLRSASGRTALAQASASGNIAAIQCLLEAGADPALELGGGDSILSLLVNKGSLVLNGSKYGRTVFANIHKGSLALLKRGANPNGGPVGCRPLESVVKMATLPGGWVGASVGKLAELLLDAGGDPSTLKNAMDEETELTSSSRAQLEGCLDRWVHKKHEEWTASVPPVKAKASSSPKMRL